MGFEWVKALVLALIPPREASPDSIYRWRVTIALILIATGGLSMANTIVILGLAPALFANVGLMGDISSIKVHQDQFVTRSDIQPLVKGMADLADGIQRGRIATLTTQLYNLRVMQCNALKSGNSEAARSHDQQLQDMEIEWRTLTHYDYQRRPCSEL